LPRSSASSRSSAALPSAPRTEPATPRSADARSTAHGRRAASRKDAAPRHDGRDLDALDLLASLVAVCDPAGRCLHVNAACEDALAAPRRALVAASLLDWFVEPQRLADTLSAVANNHFSTARLDSHLKQLPGHGHAEPTPVHVIVQQIDGGARLLVEILEFEQQWRQDREARALDQARETKELVRHLAHEIKNPLGGIRGAAQLLGMELAERQASRALTEYTTVIVAEADRLQSLVDRLLAPHRQAHVVGDVNVHEVCERVRALLLAEFGQGAGAGAHDVTAGRARSSGLEIVRDYDISIPEFRGDREGLIQAVLNIAHNAALALAPRVPAGDARIVLRTRIARQVTIGKQRWRLALVLQVEDNGPGIPPGIRDRIFLPLVSGREGGSGLGLTLAQHLVQQHEGMVEFDSAPGRTVFSIVIPLP
jgi:two-component system nitrogen regulation sensor histidine kinase GlnL